MFTVCKSDHAGVVKALDLFEFNTYRTWIDPVQVKVLRNGQYKASA